MSFCVNCGRQYDKPSGICPDCLSDQIIPEEVLSANKFDFRESDSPSFGFPGEKGALILSLIVTIIIVTIIGVISLGLFFIILLINLVYLKINHLSFQKNMIRVSENNFPKIFKLAKISAYRLRLSMPEIYITMSPEYNAYTMGFYKYGFIVIDSSLANDFKPEELLFVIGHEMGHIKRYHTTWLNLIYPAKAGGVNFAFAPIMHMIFNVWSVKAEHTADQAGLIATRDLKAAIACLLKLAGGPNVEKEVDIDKLTNPEHEGGTIISSIIEYLGTHPFIENRIKQLISFNKKRV